MQGQANVFFRYFPEKIQSVINRYQNETRRLYTVLDKQLEGREFLCDELSIADFASWPWVNIHKWSGVEIGGLENLTTWFNRCNERIGFQAGIEVPYKREMPSEKELEKFKEQVGKMLQT